MQNRFKNDLSLQELQQISYKLKKRIKKLNMSWSTELFCNITFNRETFNHIGEVQDRINDVKTYLQNAKDHLRDLLMMTEPAKFCPENYDPLIWLRNEFQDTIDSIEEYSVELYKLEILLENWDSCHDESGLAINPPDEITWKTAFLDGDFVKTIKYPNANDISEFENE